MKRQLLLSMLTGLFCFITNAQQEATFYVSPGGNDAWSGTLEAPNPAGTDGPFKTLTGARNAVRNLTLSSSTVRVREGTYRLQETFTLDQRDSGTTYRAYPGESPVLTGSSVVMDFVPYRDGILKTDVAAQGLRDIYFRQLFCNGKRQELARYPNADPEHSVTGGWAFVSGERLKSFYADREKGDRRVVPVVPELLRDWSHPEDAELFIFARFNWINHIVDIQSIDREAHTLTLAKPLLFAAASDDRFFFRNLLEELDAPGEWYLDKRTWTLYFMPPAELKTMTVEVPRMQDLIFISDAANVTIQGFTLQQCDGNGVVLRSCTDCLVAANTIRQVGGYCAGYSGVNIIDGQRNGAVGNDIYDIGADAVRIRGGDTLTLTPAGNYADNNYMHHLGVFKRHSQGVAMYGVGNRATHNLIHDSPRAGIAGSGNDLIIAYNRIRHVNLETEDSGAIYVFSSTAGFCRRGTQVLYNFISDSLGFGRRKGHFLHPFYAHGIYLDDAVCGVHVYGNIVTRTSADPVYIHGGSDNVVENNVIVDSGTAQMLWQYWWPSDSHWEKIRREYEKYGKLDVYLKYPNYTARSLEDVYRMQDNSFQHNIIYYCDPKRQAYRHRKLPLDKTRIDSNLIFSGDGPVTCGLPGVRAPDQWSHWQEQGLDVHSVIADPEFVAPNNDDFRLKSTSPAFALGFKPIPIDEIGPYGSSLRATWPIREAEGAREYPLVIAKPPPRTPLPKPPPITASRISTVVIADGIVGPNEWPGQDIPITQHVSAYSATKMPCSASVCHDGVYLYVRITVPVSDAGKLKLDTAWNDADAAEICFASGSGPVFVIHGYADGRHESVGDAGASQSLAKELERTTRFAARTGDKSWTAEWAVPLKTADISPVSGTRLMFNLGVHRTETREWIMWVGTGGSTWLVDNAGILTLE